jgi:hypothetical protein
MARLLFVFNLLLLSLFTQAQNIGINTNTPAYPLDIKAAPASMVTASVSDNVTTGQRLALSASINTTTPVSSAIGASTYEGGGVSPIESVTYAIVGSSGNGYAIGGYSISGTALRGKSSTGLALYCSGLIKLTGLGEGAGKVLTSDAAGNASWQLPTVGAHTHFGSTWSGAGTGALFLGNSGADGVGLSIIESGTGNTAGLRSFVSSAAGVAVVGVNNSSGSYHPGLLNTAVSGLAGDGTGVFGASLSGLSIYGLKENFGIAAGSVARFTNQKTGITDPVVLVEAVDNQPALELSNGGIKVSGTNKMAFKHLTTAANISGNQTNLAYANQDATDILIVTRIFNTGSGTGGTYLNKNYAVWWKGTNWTIYLEDLSTMPVNVAFNVMVIKQ